MPTRLSKSFTRTALRRRCCVKTPDQDGGLKLRRIHSRLHHTLHAERRQHRSHVGKQIAKEPHKAQDLGKGNQEQWLAYTPSGPSYKDTQKEMSLQGPINNRLRGHNRVTGALLVPCVQRTRLPLPFMDNALSHVLIPVWANLEYGTSGIASSHGLIGSVSEARVTDVVLHLIRAQGRVVRQEARTRSCCQV